jgi:hypothetical protein
MIFKPAKRRVIFRYFLISLIAFPILGIMNMIRPMAGNWFISALVMVVAVGFIGGSFCRCSINTIMP